jgi:hypothetical protein
MIGMRGTLAMPSDIRIDQAPRSGGYDLTVRVTGEEMRAWKDAARRNGMGMAQWISLSLTLAEKMALVDGHQRNPAIGRKIDPVLAKAIAQAAKGQPWEHRAMLLLGIGAESDEVKTPVKRSGRIPVELTDLFAEYGIPYRDVAPNYFAVLGDWVLSWQELALVLTIWREVQFDWSFMTVKRLQELAGMTTRDTKKAMERAVAQGVVEREPLDLGRGNGRSSMRTRVAKAAGEALLRGEIRPATVDDSFSESYLTAQSMVSAYADGSEVDPLLLKAARQVAETTSRPTASAVISRYLEAKEASQSTT